MNQLRDLNLQNNILFKSYLLLIAVSSILLFLSASCSSNKIEFTKWELVASSQNFPEGITWSTDHILYSSNCNGGWITRISEVGLDTFLIASDSTFGKTNGMIAFNDGSLIACDYGIGAIIKFERNGKREILVDGYKDVPLNRPNDLSLDKDGNLFFTDPKTYSKDNLDGRVFFYDFSNKTLKVVSAGLAFPNGIGISPIDDKLYVCESAKSRILSFTIDENNNLQDKQVFIELPGGDPDGFNFDVNGNMYVAHFGGGAIYVISPSGEILHKIKTPGSKPSNVEFAGPDRKTFYITEDETNSIYKCNISIEGYSSI